MLCFAVLNVTQLSRSTVQHVHGLVIGFCVVVGGSAPTGRQEFGGRRPSGEELIRNKSL